MKKVINCKRVCFYDVCTGQTTHILSDHFSKHLSDYDILCCVYNPDRMEWSPRGNKLWVKGTWIRVDVYAEYREKKQWFDPIVNLMKKWFMVYTP